MDNLTKLYSTLYLARAAENGIMRYYHEDDMKTPMHMSFGQEVVPVGVCGALQKEDQVFGTYRSHSLYLAKVGNLVKFFGEMYGKTSGMVNGKAGSMHMSDREYGFMGASAVVGSTIPVAIGAAFSHKYKNDGYITASFFGDGAADEGDFWESINIATSMGLPILFVLEDNGFAVHTVPDVRNGYKDIASVMSKFNFAHVSTVDTVGNPCVERVFVETQLAITRMRQLSKPAFIVFKVERGLEHVGVTLDYDIGYRQRPSNVVDCIVYNRERLVSAGVNVQEIEVAIDAAVEDAIQQAKVASFPDKQELYEEV